MAMTICSECKGEKSDKALMCPHCGFGLEQSLEDVLRRRIQEIRPVHEEKRRHRRIDLRTMVRVNGETAMLFNISRSGLKLSSPFKPQTGNVDISLDNGETVFALKGVIRWVSGRRSFSNLVDFGVEIIAAPPEYYAFLDELELAP
jgi:hypothetical protein